MSKRIESKEQISKLNMESQANKTLVLTERRTPRKQNLITKNHVQTSKPASPSIIKIVPNNPSKQNKELLPSNCSVKTFMVNRQDNLQPKASPSTSTSSATDHEYVSKDGSVDKIVNIVYVNEDHQVTGVFLEDSNTNKPKINNLKRHLDDDILETPNKISKVHSENCCSICRDTLESILQKQEEILKYLKSGSSLYRDLKFDLLPPMPFNDLNDFLDFDESLSNDNVLQQLVAKLQRLLVSIDKKSVSNIMSCIMTNDLCKRISWIGIKDTIAFQNTHMVNHIIDVIQDHHGLDVDFIKSYIAEWLRRCSDRIASEIRKSKKKAQQLGYEDT